MSAPAKLFPAQLVPPLLSALTVAVAAVRHADVAAAVRPIALGGWLLPSFACGLLATLLALFAPGAVPLLNVPVGYRERWHALPPAARAGVDRAAAGLVVGLAGFFWLMGVLFTLLLWDRAHGLPATPWPVFAVPVPALIAGLGSGRIMDAIERAERAVSRLA